MPDEVKSALRAVVDEIGGQHREGQEQMAEAVAEAMAEGRHVLVQAGTGTGKSMGYLVPAALHAASTGTAVVVATATLALQRQLIERDLPRLSAALAPILGRPVSYAVLKGRNNYVCLQRLHGAVPEEEGEALFDSPRSALGEQVVAVREWAEQTETGDRDEYREDIDARIWRSISVGRRECVGESKCAFGEECFTAKRRVLAQGADIVVTNHALLAIDAIEGIPVLPEHSVVIVDEGHELVDRVTAAVSIELAAPAVERAVSRARAQVDVRTAASLEEAADALAAALAEAAEAVDGPARLLDLPRSLVLALSLVRDSCHAAIPQFGADADDQDALAASQRARGAIEEVHETAGSLLAAGEGDVMWLDPGEGRSPALKLAPLSVSGLLRDAIFGRNPVVLTSATLATGGGFEPVLAELGLGDVDATALDVGSPFDYGKQGILYVARHLPPPGRDGVAMEALDELAELIEAAGGRTLALFSSWRGVERAADYLRVRLDTAKTPLLVHRRGEPVGLLIDRFSADPASVLLGTVSLWQGVDVPGDACICVVIDRIPFPRPDDPLISARQRAVDEAGGSGFRSIAVPRAGLLLAQGSGRLVRTPTDRGVVAVLDSRLATAGYGSALRASMPPFWYTTDREQVLGSLQRLRDQLAEGAADPAGDSTGASGSGANSTSG